MSFNIYSLIQQKELYIMLEALEACVELTVQILDPAGAPLEQCGQKCAFCSRFSTYLPQNESCENLHINAAKKAVQLGEAYIFSCHANLNHIVFPINVKDTFLGSVLLGPFLMDKPDSYLLLKPAKRYKIPVEELLTLFEELGNIKILPPSKVTHISRLLYYIFASLVPDERPVFKANQMKLYQQAQINESIQQFKLYENYDKRPSYPYEKEKELIAKVKMKNINDAKGIMNDLLGYVFFSEGSSLEIIKSRAVELSSLLSRAAIEGGAVTDRIFIINNVFIKKLQETVTFEDLCYQLQEVAEAFTENMFNRVQGGNHELIQKAVYYIATNFSAKLTLENVSGVVHLNPSYFSSLFKKCTGSSFKEYLNLIRIEESKRLLANTDYTIIDIAVATGFEDQSYFTKVFKKYTGLTPKQYR